MSIMVGDNFSYKGAKPLDARTKFATISDMVATPVADLYDGCEAYVTATKKYYSFDSSNTADPTLGKWRERTSGGGGGGVSDYSDLTGKPSIDGVTLDGAMTAEDLGLAKETDIPDVPTKTSDLNNDSGFITNVVNDLVNYYLKTETYSKTETDSLIAAIKNSRFKVVSVLPTEDIQTNVIYLVPKSDAETDDVKDEYINLDGTTTGWEKIGSTSVDLSGYVTDSDLASALNDYVAKADMSTYLADYALAADVHNIPEGGTAGQVLKKKTATDYDVEWSDEEGGGSGGSIVNGYIYREPFVATTAMDYIKWIRNHTDKEIKVTSESLFANKPCNCFYMVLGPSEGYFLFSEYAFNLKAYHLSRSGNNIYNSSRYTQDGVSHPGYSCVSNFNYTNGIQQCNSVTISGSSEVDCSAIVDTYKAAKLYVTPNINFDTNNYAANTVVIQNDLAFYSDSSHTTVITPASDTIYVDVPTGNMYEWDGTEYKQIGSQDIPTKTSDLVNDSGFITKAVSDLVNYYLKSETYSKTEVDALIGAISGMHFVSVSELPTTDIQTNAIYLVPSADAKTQNIKDEYINLDGTTSGWEKIGSSQIDLSGYVTDTELTTALADYTTTANLTTLLSEKQDKAQFGVMPAASIDYAGRIVQYTGVTDSSYTHGYFYECKESDGSYSWVQTNVQSSSGGGGGSYTAGDGITIENDVISADTMESTDMDDVVNPLPSGKNAGIILKKTMTAGSTTVTFTDIPTDGDYLVDFYNSFGINYTEITPSSGSVTLTYPAQSADMAVYCEIREV